MLTPFQCQIYLMGVQCNGEVRLKMAEPYWIADQIKTKLDSSTIKSSLTIRSIGIFLNRVWKLNIWVINATVHSTYFSIPLVDPDCCIVVPSICLTILLNECDSHIAHNT